MIIGIPRTLHYYNFYPLWKTFLSRLGHTVLVSEQTNRVTIERGMVIVPEDKCLPYKAALGHAASLEGKCDILFVPAVANPAKECYYCPSMIYFPDVVRLQYSRNMQLMTEDLDHACDKAMFRSYVRVGYKLGAHSGAIERAFREGIKVHADFVKLARQGVPVDDLCEYIEHSENYDAIPRSATSAGGMDVTLLLLGHNYFLHDRFLTFDLIHKLNRMGIKVVTSATVDDLSELKDEHEMIGSVKWFYSKQTLQAVHQIAGRQCTDGIISVIFFNCTTGAANTKFIEHINARLQAVPLMNLLLDEHTSETGTLTRLEAFVETVKNVKKDRTTNESNVSAFYQPNHAVERAV